MRRILLATMLVLAAVGAPPAEASGGRTEVRFATFNLSLNRPEAGLLREHLASPDVDDVYRRQAKNVAEVIQRARPDVVLRQRVRLRPRGGPAVRRELPRRLAERRAGAALPVPVRRAVEHRRPVRVRPEQQRRRRHDAGRRRLRRRLVRVRPVPGPVRDGRLLEVPDRPPRGAHVPAVQVAGHARQPAARRLLLARGAGGPAAVVEEPLGRADQGGPAEDRALPGVAPDAADVRRARGPERPPQPRRDPVLGRLRVAGAVLVRLRRQGPARRAAGRAAPS